MVSRIKTSASRVAPGELNSDASRSRARPHAARFRPPVCGRDDGVLSSAPASESPCAVRGRRPQSPRPRPPLSIPQRKFSFSECERHKLRTNWFFIRHLRLRLFDFRIASDISLAPKSNFAGGRASFRRLRKENAPRPKTAQKGRDRICGANHVRYAPCDPPDNDGKTAGDSSSRESRDFRTFDSWFSERFPAA